MNKSNLVSAYMIWGRPVLLLMTLVKEPQRLGNLVQRNYCKGEEEGSSYKLKITDLDFSESSWFLGYLAVNDTDTLLLIGFEKGNNHPTFVGEIGEGETIKRASVLLWTKCWEADTIELKNNWYTISYLPKRVWLIKTNSSPQESKTLQNP